MIWHDLRHTCATELRARQVHEYDIADLLGHNIQAVTGTYARSTPEALEEAVKQTRLAEKQGDRVQKEGELGGLPSWPHLHSRAEMFTGLSWWKS